MHALLLCSTCPYLYMYRCFHTYIYIHIHAIPCSSYLYIHPVILCYAHMHAMQYTLHHIPSIYTCTHTRPNPSVHVYTPSYTYTPALIPVLASTYTSSAAVPYNTYEYPRTPFYSEYPAEYPSYPISPCSHTLHIPAHTCTYLHTSHPVICLHSLAT